MEFISLKNVSLNSKILLLKELGYNSDGEFVVGSDGNKVVDRYLNIPIMVNNMVIFPGSEIILDDNELSISSYIQEFGEDVLE
ncbi:MAG: hypothetical protein Q7J54_07615 [Candidatus Woesearchaeota archaeon]|nr:hypothetical protein [Candidatus Woesearchaeota archaeon]